MPATYVESLTNPRDSLPNVFTNVTAREQDFVSVFNLNWDALRQILGITRPIRKAPGTKLISYKASVALESGDVEPGEVIPYSKATVVQADMQDLSIKKYAKAVTIEDVAKYGAAIAIEKTDEAFRNQLQNEVLSSFYTFLNTGALTNIETTFQMALSMAKGLVINKFKQMRKTATAVVGFVNVLDVHQYIGSANITVQNRFGFDYVKDFMGYSTLFLLSEPDIARGTVIALPVENIDLYYIDPGDSEFARLGLNYTTAGETNLVGFHAEGNYTTAVGETFALMGMKLWAEFIDGIAVVKVEASGSIGSISGFSTAAYSAGSAGDSELTVPDPDVAGGKFYFKAQASTAPSAPTYLSQFDPTGWTEVVDDQVVATTNGHKYRVVEVNGSGQVISTADGTVTAKT
ncbi:MAG: hypothetical protein IKW70_04375 [Verrucomicrobia bacterium]|nr:hypothetical protein [Verrucomicrobiota bacterium]